MLPLYIIEAIEEAGYPLPSLDVRMNPCKQQKYEEMENKNERLQSNN